MTGDVGSETGRPRSRPSFLPPIDGYPPLAGEHAEPIAQAPPPPARPPRHGAAWNIAMIVSASVLLVSAFLPWARAQVVVDLFGRPLSRDLGSAAGIEADGLVVTVPVLAVLTIVLACWDLAGRDARISALGAIPGVLSLLTCGTFVLRLGDATDHIPGVLPGTGTDYRFALEYGWYLGVATSLLVIGFSLARPISERVSGKRHHRYEPYAPPWPDAASPEGTPEPETPDQPQTEQHDNGQAEDSRPAEEPPTDAPQENQKREDQPG